jgi:hypothetical protein
LGLLFKNIFPPTLYCQEQTHKLAQSKLVTLYPLIVIENQKQNCLLFPQGLRVNALNRSIDTFIIKKTIVQLFNYLRKCLKYRKTERQKFCIFCWTYLTKQLGYGQFFLSKWHQLKCFYRLN